MKLAIVVASTFVMFVSNALSQTTTAPPKAPNASQRYQIGPRVPVPPQGDLMSGVWIVDPAACGTGTKGQFPPQVGITLKSTNAATGERTYHVFFTLTATPPIPRALLAFDEDVTTNDNTYLLVKKDVGPYANTVMVVFRYWTNKPANPLRAELYLSAFGGDWQSDAASGCTVYIRKPA